MSYNLDERIGDMIQPVTSIAEALDEQIKILAGTTDIYPVSGDDFTKFIEENPGYLFETQVGKPITGVAWNGVDAYFLDRAEITAPLYFLASLYCSDDTGFRHAGYISPSDYHPPFLKSKWSGVILDWLRNNLAWRETLIDISFDVGFPPKMTFNLDPLDESHEFHVAALRKTVLALEEDLDNPNNHVIGTPAEGTFMETLLNSDVSTEGTEEGDDDA